MMKLFRVHHVHANGLETLALTVSAGGLKSAVKRVREHPLIRLPNGTYYIFEAGNYQNGWPKITSGPGATRVIWCSLHLTRTAPWQK